MSDDILIRPKSFHDKRPNLIYSNFTIEDYYRTQKLGQKIHHIYKHLKNDLSQQPLEIGMFYLPNQEKTFTFKSYKMKLSYSGYILDEDKSLIAKLQDIRKPFISSDLNKITVKLNLMFTFFGRTKTKSILELFTDFSGKELMTIENKNFFIKYPTIPIDLFYNDWNHDKEYLEYLFMQKDIEIYALQLICDLFKRSYKFETDKDLNDLISCFNGFMLSNI